MLIAPVTLVMLGALAVPAAVAQPRQLTAADYERAARFLSYNVTPLVQRSGVRPTWLDDDRFWYRMTKEDGSAEFVVIDAAKAARTSSDKQPEGDTSGRQASRSEVVSPDGKRAAFIRDSNLWVRDVEDAARRRSSRPTA